MPNQRRVRTSFAHFLLAALGAILVASCQDQNPVEPPPPPPLPPEKATIIVMMDPDSIQEDWALTGPDDFFQLGRGTATLNDLEAGSYTINWPSPTCWSPSSPVESTAAATAGDTTVFDQVYDPLSGACGQISITIIFPEAQFASISVPWTLSGPNGFSLSGQDTDYLWMIPPGDYRIQWNPPAGFRFLVQEQATTVTAGENGFLSAIFQSDPSQYGRINVINYPLGLNAFWEITGPGRPYTGYGSQAINNLVPGDYRIAWAEVPDYSLAPETELTLHLDPHQGLAFTGTYRSLAPVPVPGIQARPGDGPGLIEVSWQRVQDALYPILTYEIRTGTDGPITDDNWNQARFLYEQGSVPNQESYTRIFPPPKTA